ncbi:hypothetical protein FDUTEX481_02705 [Tolypothrix sp. PCC 7601]|nr:hypothetical protein FDUTEX481_02705 [Tolypothrix sp. PCC 7601]
MKSKKSFRNELFPDSFIFRAAIIYTTKLRGFLHNAAALLKKGEFKRILAPFLRQ